MSSSCQSEQYTIKKNLDAIDWVRAIKPIYNINIEWVSGHEGSEGNEQADQVTKMAATPNSAISTKMRSAQKGSIQAMTKTKWEIEWRTGKETIKHQWKLSQPDTATGSKVYGALQQRKCVVWIAQLIQDTAIWTSICPYSTSLKPPIVSVVGERRQWITSSWIASYMMRSEIA